LSFESNGFSFIVAFSTVLFTVSSFISSSFLISFIFGLSLSCFVWFLAELALLNQPRPDFFVLLVKESSPCYR
jgi:hypothetical protein